MFFIFMSDFGLGRGVDFDLVRHGAVLYPGFFPADALHISAGSKTGDVVSIQTIKVRLAGLEYKIKRLRRSMEEWRPE